MSLLDVRAALLTRATAASPGAALPDATTWYENKKKWSGSTELAPPTTSLWYRIIWMPNAQPNSDGIGQGAKVRHTGFLQINVCEPRDNGDVPMTTEAQRIMDCFKMGLHLSYNSQGVSILSTGMVKGLYDGTTGNPVIAVRVYWVADVVN